MPRGKFRRVLGQGRENVHGRRPYLSFGWFRRPSQIPIMIQSKLFPIWNNAKWDSSCKTTRSRSNRNWYKILHFYKLYSLRFLWIFFFWNFILFFENLNSLYSRGRLKKVLSEFRNGGWKIGTINHGLMSHIPGIHQIPRVISSVQIIWLTGRFILWTHSYILLLTAVNISYFP